MTDISVELVIPCAPKDEIKLSAVLASVDANLTEISAAHIITPNGVTVNNRYSFPVYLHADRDVVDFNPQCFRFRPTWVYQQFLKLFQDVTTTDWFLVMDADRFLNRPRSLFEDDKPMMFLSSRDQFYDFYFDYSQKMIGVGKVYTHSFLSECTLYNKTLIHEMLSASGLDKFGFLSKSAEIIDATCCIGDAELYGNFVWSRYPELYKPLVLHDEIRGKYPEAHGEWSVPEIDRYVEEMRQRGDIDIFSAHSWHD